MKKSKSSKKKSSSLIGKALDGKTAEKLRKQANELFKKSKKAVVRGVKSGMGGY